MKLFFKNIHFVVAGLVLVIAAAHWYILRTVSDINMNLAVKDMVVNTSLLVVSLWSVYLIIGSYPTRVAIKLYAASIAIFFTVIAVFFSWEILKIWLGAKEPAYYAWLNHTLPLRFIIELLLNCGLALYLALSKKTDALEEKFRQHEDAAVLLREAELFKLRQQLQPHFLYNSLNSISALVMIQPDKAQEMIGKLSDFLRSSVKREAQDEIPIAEELTYIESYLSIESVRFGDRLKVVFRKDYTDDARIPPFLFQPILENAIKYGLYGKTGEVEIGIHIALEGDFLTMIVSNPFDPQTAPSRGTGFGLQGIRRRLYLLYARTDLLETKKDEETFTTILKIPQRHV